MVKNDPDCLGCGVNSIGISCQPDGIDVIDFPTDYEWPKCIRETECVDLPLPTDESRLQKSPKIGDSVKIGEYVRYTCIDKDLYHETDQVGILETVQDFLCKLGMKPQMHLVKTIIFSLYHVIVGPTKIIKNPLKDHRILIFKVIFWC